MGMTEPGPTITYLMNEHLTMLDWGMFKLQQRLTELGDNLRSPSSKRDSEPIINQPPLTIINYDWDSNRLKIQVLLFKEEFKTKQKAENWCTSVIHCIKGDLGIDPKTGKPSRFMISGTSNLLIYFTHIGFQGKLEPEGLGTELDKITEISVSTRYLEGKEKRVLRCESPLLGTKIFFAK